MFVGTVSSSFAGSVMDASLLADSRSFGLWGPLPPKLAPRAVRLSLRGAGDATGFDPSAFAVELEVWRFKMPPISEAAMPEGENVIGTAGGSGLSIPLSAWSIVPVSLQINDPGPNYFVLPLMPQLDPEFRWYGWRLSEMSTLIGWNGFIALDVDVRFSV